MRIAVALLSMLVSVSGAAALEKDQAYSTARSELLDEGWKPSTTITCEASKNVCAAYPEVEACAPTGVAACIMHFARGKERLTITTENEMPEDWIVTGWR